MRLKYMYKILIITLLSVQSLAGCASVTAGEFQKVRINSTPEGARAEVGGHTITTPGEVTLKGKSEYRVTAHKEGYEKASNVIHSQVRILPAVVGNIFNFTGIVGMAIDFFATGAAYKLEEEVHLTLTKKPTATNENPLQ